MIAIADISSNNGVIDFSKIAGIGEIFIRSSLGFGSIDKMLNTNAQKAFAAKLPLSYYHFAYPDQKQGGDIILDARAEANFFIDTVNRLPKYEHLAVDCENFSKDKDTTLTPEQYGKWLTAFLETVFTRTGKKCIVYSYKSYLDQHLPKKHKFGDNPLWIANYSVPTTKQPPLPEGWNDYFMWQYTQEGTVPGISTNVDLSLRK